MSLNLEQLVFIAMFNVLEIMNGKYVLAAILIAAALIVALVAIYLWRSILLAP